MSLTPQFIGYRIRQSINTESEVQESQQTLLKIIIKNESNGVPKIRNDVVCNGKHYPFIPLFTFTTQDDLKVIEQISTIVLRDENEILCEILSGKIRQVRSSHFKELRTRFKAIFSLDLKIDPEELFLIIISDQIAKETEFNDILDSITETEFVNLLKKIFQNCPNRVLPKILRKFAKYFNTTKGRPVNSIQRLKKILKLIKSADQNPEPEQKQQVTTKNLSKNQNEQEEEWVVVGKKTKKTKEAQKVTEPEQKPLKKPQFGTPAQNKETEIIISKEPQVVVKKTEKIKKAQKVTKKQKILQSETIKTTQKEFTPKKGHQQIDQNEQNWEDVDSEEDEKEELEVHGGFDKNQCDLESSDEDLKYQVPKKKGKKYKNANIYLDPQVQTGLGKKPAREKKQKKNSQPTNNNLTNQGKPKKTQIQEEEEEEYDPTKYGGKQQQQNTNNNNKNRNKSNGRNNGQSLQKGRREFSTQNKKLDGRILLGINGASDSVWREKMRPPRYINKENDSFERGAKNQSFKENNPVSKQQKVKPLLTVKQEQTKIESQSKGESAAQQPSRNLTLQKVFSFPEDNKEGKSFGFQKRNYNLFVNKLFWVNISGDQVTVQKQGKGYIRKCAIEIIDNGKGIMMDGLTINLDGLSNLEDGGTAFGNPVFEEFVPDGQWFNISWLDVFTYV